MNKLCNESKEKADKQLNEMRKTICNVNNSIEKTKILKKINSGLRNEDINESNRPQQKASTIDKWTLDTKDNNKDSKKYKHKNKIYGIQLKDEIYESFHRKSKLNI